MAEYSWLIDDIETLSTYTKDGYTKAVLNQAVKAIHKLSADVQPIRHGRWGHMWVCSNMTGYEYACSCSECGKPTYRISTFEDMPPYCPNCGAKMDGDY